MGKRGDLIALYAEELRNKCGIDPDLELLTKVTIGCGPAIYDPDAALVSADDPEDLEATKRNFVIRKLGLPESQGLMDSITEIIDSYGQPNQPKYRAVVYYMLTKHFRREAILA